jgi:hypothetical protein
MVNTRSGLQTSAMAAPKNQNNPVLDGYPLVEDATSSHGGNEGGANQGAPAMEVIHAMQAGITQLQTTQAQLLAAIAGLTEVITAALPRAQPAVATQQIHAGGESTHLCFHELHRLMGLRGWHP